MTQAYEDSCEQNSFNRDTGNQKDPRKIVGLVKENVEYRRRPRIIRMHKKEQKNFVRLYGHISHHGVECNLPTETSLISKGGWLSEMQRNLQEIGIK